MERTIPYPSCGSDLNTALMRAYHGCSMYEFFSRRVGSDEWVVTDHEGGQYRTSTFVCRDCGQDLPAERQAYFNEHAER